MTPSYLGAVKGEVLKLSRQRALWLMIGLGVLLFAFVGAAIFTADGVRQTESRSPAVFFYNALDIMANLFGTGAGIVLLITSSRLFGMEYSSGTIRILLARGTGRLQLYAAKLTALLLLGVLLLVGFTAVASILIYLVVSAWQGNGSALTSLPGEAWRDFQLTLLVGLVSVVVTSLLGSAAAIAGRSLSFGIAVAMAFFPADNFAVIVLSILQRITRNDAFNKATAYLLGPNLNLLSGKLETAHHVRAAFATPAVAVDLTHVWTVIAVYAAIFLVGSLALLLRRDVLE